MRGHITLHPIRAPPNCLRCGPSPSSSVTFRVFPPWNMDHEAGGGPYWLCLTNRCMWAKSTPDRIGEKSSEGNDDGHEDPLRGAVSDRYASDCVADRYGKVRRRKRGS